MDEMTDKEWDQYFDIFWSKWPQKKARKPAHTSWMKIKPKTKSQFQSVYLSLEDHLKRSAKWKEGFIPMCSTWLNQERYYDDLGPTIIKAPRHESQEATQQVFELIGYQDKATYEKCAQDVVERDIIAKAAKWKTVYPHNPRVRRYIDLMPDSAKEKLKSLIRQGS